LPPVVPFAGPLPPPPMLGKNVWSSFVQYGLAKESCPVEDWAGAGLRLKVEVVHGFVEYRDFELLSEAKLESEVCAWT
jgi:hypothetical protein